MKQWKSPDFSELNIEDTSWLDDLFDDDWFDDDWFEDWECNIDKWGNALHQAGQIIGDHFHKPLHPTDRLS